MKRDIPGFVYMEEKMRRNELLFTGLAAASALGLSEAVLRLRDRANAKSRFQRERWTLERSWERFDPRSGWELKPGYATDDIRVNSRGFRGEDIDDGWTTKIACLGGSATFGSLGENTTYPYALRAVLTEEIDGCPFEVVNAGVTGHSTYNMRFRIERILDVRPDLVIILAGEEDLYMENISRYRDNRQTFSSYWHIESQRNIHVHLWSLLRETTGFADRKPFPLSYSPKEFAPYNFEYNLTRIIGCIRKGRVQTALVTVPRLLTNDVSRMTKEDRKRINMPDFLEESDLDGLNALCGAYDAAIRVVARKNDVPLIDAARLFEETDTPRGYLFENMFNLTPEGNRMLGAFIARNLREKGLAG